MKTTTRKKWTCRIFKTEDNWFSYYLYDNNTGQVEDSGTLIDEFTLFDYIQQAIEDGRSPKNTTVIGIYKERVFWKKIAEIEKMYKIASKKLEPKHAKCRK